MCSERRRLLIVAGTLVLTSAPATAALAMAPNPISVALEVAFPAPGDVMAKVTYRNVSQMDVWLLRDMPNLFLRVGGKDVRDVGPSEKREPYGPDDFERVPPGQQVTRTADITRKFAYLAGRHTYELWTGSGYRDPKTGEKWSGTGVTASFEFER